ncbi:Phage tail protein [Kosakonia quasisacchari]
MALGLQADGKAVNVKALTRMSALDERMKPMHLRLERRRE